MAKLILQIGSLSAESVTNDAKAKTIIDNFLEYMGGNIPSTDQEKIQVILNYLINHIVDGHKIKKAQKAASNAEQNTLSKAEKWI